MPQLLKFSINQCQGRFIVTFNGNLYKNFSLDCRKIMDVPAVFGMLAETDNIYLYFYAHRIKFEICILLNYVIKLIIYNFDMCFYYISVCCALFYIHIFRCV